MSWLLIDYLEQRITACDQMIETATDADTRTILEATRERYRTDIAQLRREAAVRRRAGERPA